jgi:high-affinity iron transporter
MLPAAIITFREGLEAALIVGIVLGYLIRIGQGARLRFAWAGVISAAAASIGIALALQWIGAELEEPYEQIFEGTTMLVAVGILTWMIFWMRYQARFMKMNLEQKVKSALTRGAAWGLLALTFFAVFREGVETALFLSASAFAGEGASTLVGAVIGLALAVAVGWAIYAMAVRLNVKLFFDVTSIFLLLFAAGLLAQGVHEFQEIGWLPMLTNTAWTTKWLLDDQSLLGSILHSLVGYNDTPSALQVVTYLGYWIVVLQAIRWWTQRLSARALARRAA